MRPVLCEGDSSSFIEQSTSESMSMSSVFDQQPEPVRASTPVSYFGDESPLNETPCSVIAPDGNISLISELVEAGTQPAINQVQSQDSLPLLPGYTFGSLNYGFKLVGDNLDKTVKPRDMRGSQSFNVYAVRDRIDFTSLSSDTTVIDTNDIDISQFLSSVEEEKALLKNFSILIFRLLCQHIPALQEYCSCLVNRLYAKLIYANNR